jgi:DNA topoisomerase-1
MKPALIDQNLVSIGAGPYQFNASGSTIRFPGFMALYRTAEDEAESNRGKEKLPELEEGRVLALLKYEPKQHFTLPPPRFSEASLVKELEENGIGRPSTYAAILSTIRDKGYVELIKGYFRPSELGFIVNDLLVKSFPDVFDVEFTARMEDNLDRIESAEINALNVLSQFYAPFKSELDAAGDGMISVKGVGLPSGITCPECGSPLNIKLGKNGHFLACSAYPECRFTRDYIRDEKGYIRIVDLIADEKTDKICEKCGQPMVIKTGKYGSFMACSGFPECKHTMSLLPPGDGKKTGVSCPEPNCTGEIIEKKSKRGKLFYGCNRYPDCKFAIWEKPVPTACPLCGAAFLVEKTSKKAGTIIKCRNSDCGYSQPR